MSLLNEALRPATEETPVAPADPLEQLPDEEALKPLAVIIVSSAQYLSDPAIEPWVAPFYFEVQKILEERGYRVEYDAGEAWSSPPRHAKVWVGHDLGAKRFHRAPSHMQLLRLETQAAYEDFPTLDMRRRNQSNYTLSDRDRERLQALGEDPS